MSRFCSATLALFLAASLACAEEEKPVLKVYDVGFLTLAQQDYPGAGLAGAHPQGPEAVMDSESPSFLTTDDLVEAIRTNFHEDSWADNAHSIQAQDGRLIVVNTPTVHEVIGRYLAVLRARRGAQVTVEATLVLLSPATLEALEAAGGESAALNDKQIALLTAALAKPEEARVVNAARVTAFSGQRVNVRNARMLTYLYDYDCEVAEKAHSSSPIPGRLEEGALCDVRPMIDFGGNRISLEVRYEQQALAAALAPFDIHTDGIGPLHLPVLGRVATRTNLAAAPGSTLLAAVTSITPLGEERRCVALLLKPTIVKIIAEPSQPVESAEKRQFRMFDVGFLTRTVPDFPGPSLAPEPLDSGAVGGVAFTIEESVDAGLTIEPDQLLELVQQNVAPDSWSNNRNRITYNGSQLMVVQTPDVLDKVQEYISALAREHGRLVRIEAIVLESVKDLALPAPGAPMSAEAVKALATGPDARVLAQASAWGMNRQRIHVAGTVMRSYVSALQTEIATDSVAKDPVIGQVQEGFVLDVRPTLAGDGASVLLDLRPALARLMAAPTVIATLKDGNLVHLVDLEETQPQMNLTVKDGDWSVASVAAGRAILVRVHAAKTP